MHSFKLLAAGPFLFALLFPWQTVFAQDTTLHWENPPETYEVNSAGITIRTNDEQYLWGDNHVYDFDFPYSHFYYRHVAGNFKAETKVILSGMRSYGNEGLLVKITPANWIKLYVAKDDSVFRLSTVYADDNGRTDYSAVRIQVKNDQAWLRVCRENGVLYLFYSLDGLAYETIRMLRLPENYRAARVGLMADSPMSVGFDAIFEDFRVLLY